MIPDDPAPWLLYACPCGCGLLITAEEYRMIAGMITTLRLIRDRRARVR